MSDPTKEPAPAEPAKPARRNVAPSEPAAPAAAPADPLLALGGSKRTEPFFILDVGVEYHVSELDEADRATFVRLLERRTKPARIAAFALTLRHASGRVAYPPAGRDADGNPAFPDVVTKGFDRIDPRYLNAGIVLACKVNDLDPKTYPPA